ncbi:hypothetical protein PROSTU_03853 [Providencia stuartii ATCC 25827]|uniref:Uncharacterized protein n=1 Tax=Providencia stuartii ATCC 25827 TaxID=471874 RepID=A0AA87CPL0_PROST|nr:hypothetical protein PROSTU_03853 [Providencia stuartii ATCC 25827]
MNKRLKVSRLRYRALENIGSIYDLINVTLLEFFYKLLVE